MKLALHSVSYSGTWGGQARLSLPDFIRRAKELGYEGIELAAKRPHASPLDLGKRERGKLRRQIEDAELGVCALASYHDWAGGWAHRDMAHGEKEMAWFDAVARLAHDLGAPVVRTYTGFADERATHRQQWEQVVAGLREACRRAADYGVTVGIQNHSCIAAHPDVLLDLLADVGMSNAKVVLDAPYIVIAGLPLRETVLKFRGLVAHSHLTDFLRRPVYRYDSGAIAFEQTGTEAVGVTPGEGPTDFREFVAALAEIGYAGWLSYEMCSPLVGGGSEENLDRNARKTLATMRAMFRDLDIGAD